MNGFWGVVIIVLLWVLLIYAPLTAIWAVNVLIPVKGVAIAYGVKEWFATFLLMLIFAILSNIRRT